MANAQAGATANAGGSRGVSPLAFRMPIDASLPVALCHYSQYLQYKPSCILRNGLFCAETGTFCDTHPLA